MDFGTALHMAVLEPAEFFSVYSVFDESRLEGTLQSLDDYKSAAEALGIKVGRMKKDEIKDAIKVADVESRFVFREDAIARLYGGKLILQPTAMLAIQVDSGQHLPAHGCGAFALQGWRKCQAWINSETGIPCKCRPDWLVMAGEIDHRHRGCEVLLRCLGKVYLAIATMGYDLQGSLLPGRDKSPDGSYASVPFHCCREGRPVGNGGSQGK